MRRTPLGQAKFGRNSKDEGFTPAVFKHKISDERRPRPDLCLGSRYIRFALCHRLEEEIDLRLESEIEEFLWERGAVGVGFATVKTLAGGPPSANLGYMLRGARSAVSFALPLDREKIREYLSKKSHSGHESDNFAVNTRSSRLAKELALWLTDRGFASKRVVSNTVYRTEVEGWQLSMPPDLSHRYVAARSGVGSFGWSGNIGMKGYGAAIILGTTVTEAGLEPTEPIPKDESFCDRCKLCAAACPSGMFSRDEETSVTLGGETFTFSARNSYLRCQLVCGGFTGLHPSGKWSTWSPGRYRIPDSEDELAETLYRAVGSYYRWPERSDGSGGYVNMALADANLRLTCGNCQAICWGDKEETRENYRLLTSSGCVVQREGGEIEVMQPGEAARAFESLDAEHRELYE
jgi:epoxyqueuosine reductase QueG